MIGKDPRRIREISGKDSRKIRERSGKELGKIHERSGKEPCLRKIMRIVITGPWVVQGSKVSTGLGENLKHIKIKKIKRWQK